MFKVVDFLREKVLERESVEEAEREFVQKQINFLFDMLSVLYSPVGRLEGSPPTVRNF